MHTKFSVGLLIALLAAVITFGGISSRNTALAQGGTCTNKEFLTTFTADLEPVLAQVSKAKEDDAIALVQSQIAVLTLRQKYEDLTVPPECFATQIAIITFVGGYGDAISIQLAKITDSQNAATYDKALAAQKERLTKLSDLFKATLGGATPAPTP